MVDQDDFGRRIDISAEDLASLLGIIKNKKVGTLCGDTSCDYRSICSLLYDDDEKPLCPENGKYYECKIALAHFYQSFVHNNKAEKQKDE